MTLRLQVEAERVLEALKRAPKLAAQLVPEAVERSIAEITRSAREFAPKAESVLTNSIQYVMAMGGFEGRMFAGVRHGRPVEEGTGIYGPEGVPSGRMPPVQSILDWVRVKRIRPNDPEMSEEDLAFLIARSIATSGTVPQPYAELSLRMHEDSTRARISGAIDRVLATVN
jgi:hypothetical protein